jgi:monoamine oxidase
MRGGREFMTEVRAVVRAESAASQRLDRQTGTLRRRTFLASAAAVSGGLAVGGRAARAQAEVQRRPDGSEPVIVVGAGLAGLAAAYRLAQAGIGVQVHEAHADRVGGRCWTARGIFGGGQLAEHGGEFIDSEHHALRRLVTELGLTLEDREHPPAGNRTKGQRTFEVLDGQAISTPPGHEWVRRLTRQARSLTDYNYRTRDAYTRAFDQMSIRDWIVDNADVTGGLGSAASARITWSVGDYWGADPAQVSALGLVDQFVGPVDRAADERWHVHGGNDQVPQLLRERLERMQPGCLVLDSPLTALHRAGAAYRLRFGSRSGWVRAAQVVLATPFTALRRVDLDPAVVSARKLQAIREQAMGTNAKILLQFDQRFGHFTIGSGQRAGAPWSGVAESDLWQGDSWDSSLTQPGRQGLLTLFTGGSYGAGLPVTRAHGVIPDRLRDQTLAYLDRFVPGVAAAYSGRGWVDSWVDDPWTHGSYTYFAPGQYTRFSGFNGRAEGGLHFAGEHTSVPWLGYLNGGVATGERAAREVVTGRRV